MWLEIHTHPIAKHAKVLFNGQMLLRCYAASEEECWADVYVYDLKGRILYNPLIKELATYRLYGHVEFVIEEKYKVFPWVNQGYAHLIYKNHHKPFIWE